MRAICLMKNSSTLSGTAFHLNDNLQRGQCCSTELRAPMKSCPGCCWKLGILGPIHTTLFKNLTQTVSHLKASGLAAYPDTCLPFQKQTGNLGISVDGNLGSRCPWKVHAATVQWDMIWRNTSLSHLSCLQCMKKLKYIYMILCDGKTHWEEYFKCDENIEFKDVHTSRGTSLCGSWAGWILWELYTKWIVEGPALA